METSGQVSLPYWRLSGFYFFYFAALGALLPYWAPYLKARGFRAAEIGELMAVLMATKILAPNVWGWIADHTGRRMPMVRLASLLTATSFSAVYWADGFWALAVVMCLYGFFWNASLPQLEAVTLSHLGPQAPRYARIRLWGSIGFILTVVILGAALDVHGTNLVPTAVLALFVGIWLSSLSVPEKSPPGHHGVEGPILGVLMRPEILAFFGACFLMQASHGAYYSFYSIYLAEHGYVSRTIGLLWALGVVAEVVLFIGMHRLLQRYSARTLLLLSTSLAALRWTVIGAWPEQLWLLALAQLLHAASFGSFHAGAIHLVHHYFVGRHQVRGQAIYSSVSFGAGGAVGSLLAGWLWEGAGPWVTFMLSSVTALAALGLCWRWVARGSDGAAG